MVRQSHRSPPPCTLRRRIASAEKVESGKPAAETHDGSHPSVSAGRSSRMISSEPGGIDRECTAESQQRLPVIPPQQVADDAAGSAASYGQKFTNHKLNIHQI